MNGTWYEDKHDRTVAFYRTFCVPACTCAACSGSGVYDDQGSPACGACGGTGRARGYPRSASEAVALMNDPSLQRSARLERDRQRREAREMSRAVEAAW